MTAVFVVCAAVGGTILACQVVLTLIGLGGEAFDIDVDGGDAGHDLGGDFHGDAGTDFHGDADSGGHAGDHAGSSWVFGVLSFRSIVAALAFFGLAGLAAESTNASTPTVIVVAVAAGIAAMYGVYFMMRTLYRLKAEGTAQIQRAVGRHATVYLRVPENQSGTGKIQINLQNRTMEYLAMTSGDEIPMGAKVEVVDVVTADTVIVKPVLETERVDHE